MVAVLNSDVVILVSARNIELRGTCFGTKSIWLIYQGGPIVTNVVLLYVFYYGYTC